MSMQYHNMLRYSVHIFRSVKVITIIHFKEKMGKKDFVFPLEVIQPLN